MFPPLCALCLFVCTFCMIKPKMYFLRSPLHLAAAAGHLPCLYHLVAHAAFINCLVSFYEGVYLEYDWAHYIGDKMVKARQSALAASTTWVEEDLMHTKSNAQMQIRCRVKLCCLNWEQYSWL